MSTKPYKGFEPKWMLQRAPENSYRSIFRWGDPDFFKYPKESLYKYVKKRCNLKDEEFMQYNDDLGLARRRCLNIAPAGWTSASR